MLLCCSTMDLQLKKAAEKPEKVNLNESSHSKIQAANDSPGKNKILSCSLWNLVYLQLEMCLDLGL